MRGPRPPRARRRFARLPVPRRPLQQLTDDHSWVSEQVRAGIDDRGRGASESKFRHIITQARSASSARSTSTCAASRCRAGDCYLICTDGLSNYVESEELARILATRFYRDCRAAGRARQRSRRRRQHHRRRRPGTRQYTAGRLARHGPAAPVDLSGFLKPVTTVPGYWGCGDSGGHVVPSGCGWQRRARCVLTSGRAGCRRNCLRVPTADALCCARSCSSRSLSWTSCRVGRDSAATPHTGRRMPGADRPRPRPSDA